MNVCLYKRLFKATVRELGRLCVSVELSVSLVRKLAGTTNIALFVGPEEGWVGE